MSLTFGHVLGALAQLAFLAVVFGALEWAFPARPEQRVFRPEWRTDLAFFFGQHFVWLGVELAGLVALRELIVASALVPASLTAGFAAQPFWLQAAVCVLAGDLLTYAYHRASHANAFLWRFHRVHHSAPHLDWLAAHREHPVDGFFTQVAMNLPAMLLGVGLGGLAALVAFRGLWAAFIHSNVRLPLGPLRLLVGAPELHHWHHQSSSPTTHNFSNLAPWTDLVFGTYHCPKTQDAPVGLPGQPSKGWLRWMLDP